MKNISILLIVTAVTLGAFIVVSKMQGSTVFADAKNKVKITENDGFRVMESNGIPDHETGKFPNDGNPNRISEQKYKFNIPLKPTVAKEEDRQQGPPPAQPNGEQGDRRGPPPGGAGGPPRGGQGRPGGPPPGGRGGPMLFGVALNGIPFDPGTGEAWNNDIRSGWNNEALTGMLNLGVDMNNAHVQPTGAYHYHGIPTGLVEKLAGNGIGKGMILIGYAADGYPVYSEYAYSNSEDAKSGLKKLTTSFRLKVGTRPGGPKGTFDGTYLQDFEYVEGLGDLDRFNGRTGITPEYPNGTYYYVITSTFPFIPRELNGVADESFRKGQPEGGNGRPPEGQRPPRGQRPTGT